MKKIILPIIILLLSINIYSQGFNDVMINPFWYFYSNNYLDAVSSGKGYTGLSGTGYISSINHNPASLELSKKYQAGLQYTYKTNQPWLESFIDNLHLEQNLFSGSLGFGYRINKSFQTGFLYSNPSSLTVDLGTIIQTNEFGQEIGRYDAYEKYVLHSFSIPIVYSIEKFKLGLTLNYSLHRRYANFDDSVFTGKFDRFNVHAGVIVKPIKNLSFGVTFIPEISGDVGGTFPHVASEETTKTVIPLRFGAGFEYTFKGNFLKIGVDYLYSHLSALDNLKDGHEVHLGLEYLVNKNWEVRTGFFNIPDPRDLSGNWGNPQ